MDNMSPQQQQDSLSRGGGQQDNRRRTKSQSYRRQSAPSLVITKALIRSKTLSRESFLVPVCPETCSLVQSYLSGSDRSFLLHGHAQLKTGMQTQDRHLFLFNDTLVIAKAKSANNFKLKAQVCVREMWTADCMDEVCEGSTNPERSFVMGWPTCNCAATFSSAEVKDRWLPLLKSRIREEKEREEPKTIPLRVYGKGINTFAVTKTLPVSNSDSTNEVIRLALQQFSIIGNVKDFQLWVISKRDNAPYPLIGHEFPFSIQMSHVRHAMSQGGGGRDPDGQRAMQLEQMQVYKQCQFIMKPRPIETLHIPAEWSQKPFKRRRSLITWAFWRGSSPHLNEPSLAGAPRGCLFGLPLSSVCVEDALPKPVMDMMAFLYHEGSWTRGIFRRPAGARAVRELRDSLDAGESQLPLTRDHVFLIAGVFKDFLRSIPSSLFCCELHEEWMDVLEEEEDEEEQVQDVKRMICRLPKENALLLRHLLAVLHGIQGNAHENQMTTFNLSVCIAPSMLWPPGALCSPEVEGEGTRKVCELVKFMIEHCQQIVGEDPSSLFGGPPQRLDTDETDSWPYPLTDSSYDSLENELDRSGSPGFCARRRTRPKTLQGSLDSILTFSDCDQDADPDNPRTRDVDLSSPSQDETTADTSSAPEPPSPDSRHRRRRRSAPAIAYKFRPRVLGGTDGLSDEDEEFSDQPGSHARGEPAALEVSSPSLSSTPTSPAQTRSSLDSPSSNIIRESRFGLSPSKTQPPSSCPPSSKPSTISSAGGHLDTGTCPKGTPPKEAVNRETLKGRSGLHPNSWLKKDRRLSLTQPDNLEKEGEEKTGGGSSNKPLTSPGKHVPEKGKAGGPKVKPKKSRGASKDAGRHVTGWSGQEPQKLSYLRHDSAGPPSHHRSAGSLHWPGSPWPPSSDYPLSFEQLHTTTGREVTEQRSPSLFYKRSGPSLSLFKQHKSHSVGEGCDARRRGSEPGRQVADRGPAFTRARLPSDPGLRSCLSPNATKAVRAYFSSHPRSNPQSGREVTLALAESRREWLKRCSDPAAEVDFDQLLFAEESYV
ncbi:rho GTPase-activating protein 20-like [Cebidichthys violaceus]|uniref:rho GTPase-activating protein 20-like n=1 Tax=Cebidichthys violaceus TaxID=271503 RepID=UPI0035CAA080